VACNNHANDTVDTLYTEYVHLFILWIVIMGHYIYASFWGRFSSLSHVISVRKTNKNKREKGSFPRTTHVICVIYICVCVCVCIWHLFSFWRYFPSYHPPRSQRCRLNYAKTIYTRWQLKCGTFPLGPHERCAI